jgi:hypothetical protein
MDSSVARFADTSIPVEARSAEVEQLGNTGTLTNMRGTEWTPGKLGNCLSFDGSNDYVVSSTLLKDQGVKEPTLRLFWTPPGGREEPVPAAAYTHRP